MLAWYVQIPHKINIFRRRISHLIEIVTLQFSFVAKQLCIYIPPTAIVKQ